MPTRPVDPAPMRFAVQCMCQRESDAESRFQDREKLRGRSRDNGYIDHVFTMLDRVAITDADRALAIMVRKNMRTIARREQTMSALKYAKAASLLARGLQ